MQEIFCHLNSLTLLGQDVYRVELKPIDDKRLAYKAGQYLTLQVEGGRWIPFSIANGPEESHIELHIRLIPGHDLAENILDQLRKTKKAHVQIPLGQCTLRDNSRPVIFIVGGTGFSPVKAMIESALLAGLNREMHLFWGANSEAEFYMKSLADKWVAENNLFSFTPVVSGDDPKWQGERGFVHKIVLDKWHDLSLFDFYISGSEVMVMSVFADLKSRGVEEFAIYSDMLDIKKEMGAKI